MRRFWMVHLPFVLLMTAALCFSSSCGGEGGDAAPVRKLTLTGSSTVGPLAAEIGKRFEKLHPGVHVDVQTGGSSRGVADARRGLADIGMASRKLKKGEEDLLSFTIARDGVGLIVHKSNPVKELSDEQVVAIYTGAIKNWKAVGGPDKPIVVINKAEGRATLEVFLHYFKLKNSQIHADHIIGENEQGIKAVAGNPNAIGYVSIGAAEYDATHGVKIKLLAVAGIVSSIENVSNGTFPISRPLNLVTKTQPEGLVKEFIDYARSDKVHDLVKKLYYVPISD